MISLFVHTLTHIRRLLPLIAVLLPVTLANAQESPLPADIAPIVPDRLIIQYRSDVGVMTAAAAIDGETVKVVDSLAQIGAQVLQVPPDRLDEIYARLQQDPSIESVAYDVITEVAAVPNDPYLAEGNQWAPQRIQALEAWDVSTGQDVIIAVVDSGVDPDHPDLRDRLIPGYNIFDRNNDTSDGCGHGTHMAGIVAATAGNAQGIAGVAHSARIMPVRVMNDSCSGSYSRLIQGIIYAADQGADVIVISSGATVDNSALRDALMYARNRGVFITAAAGNNNNDVPFYPAAYPEAISAAGTDQNDNRYTSSNYGSWIDVAAPATSIYSTFRTRSVASTYTYMTGTSMASPHVAGVAALILARNPHLSVSAIEEIIRTSADDLGAPGWDPYFGAGRINALRAVAAVGGSEPSPTPTVEPTPTATATSIPPTPTATATAVPPMPTATPTPAPPVATPTPTPTPQLQTSHIEGLLVSYAQRWPKWAAVVTFQVADQAGRAVQNATVQAQWYGAHKGAASCTTKPDGTCSVETDYLPSNNKTVSLNVNTIRHPALAYDPAANNVLLPLEGLTYRNPSAASASLTASVNENSVLLHWSLQSLPHVQQFALYRSATGNPEDAQQIAFSDMAAQGHEAAQEYSHIDAAVVQGETYTYWLVQMEGAEPVAELGQVTVPVGADSSPQAFMPIVNK